MIAHAQSQGVSTEPAPEYSKACDYMRCHPMRSVLLVTICKFHFLQVHRARLLGALTHAVDTFAAAVDPARQRSSERCC